MKERVIKSENKHIEFIEGGKELLEKMMNVSLPNFHFHNGIKAMKSDEPLFHIGGYLGDALHGSGLKLMWYYWYRRHEFGLTDLLFRNKILSFYNAYEYYNGQIKYKEEMMKKFNNSLKDDFVSHLITSLEYYFPRFHGGKISLNILNNINIVSPFVDSSIYSINYFNGKDKTFNLLPTFIYTRYMPQLLEFPISDKRIIEESTKEYSKIINEKYPRGEKNFGDLKDVNFTTPKLFYYSSYKNIFKIIEKYFNDNVQEVIKYFGKDTAEKCVEDLESMKNPKFLNDNRLIMGIYFCLELGE